MWIIFVVRKQTCLTLRDISLTNRRTDEVVKLPLDLHSARPGGHIAICRYFSISDLLVSNNPINIRYF